MRLSKLVIYRIIFLAVACLLTKSSIAQNNLDRNISINVKQKRLADLLTEIGQKGNFYFSYSSEMFQTDSLVTLSAENQTVRTLLDKLFNNKVDYRESPGYIILRPAPNHLALIPDSTEEPENTFIISGYVLDDSTGRKLPNASVFERHLLVSTLTDQNGFFKLKLKASGSVALTVSKEYYKDTTVNFLSKVTVSVKPPNYSYDPAVATNKTERSWAGRLFISSRLKIQSLNIGGFITGVPVQTSLLPGVGSHGLLSGQIVNKFSLNVLGGYNAGVNGLEVGGLYNLNKQDVKYVQVAGLFNVVGGDFTGLQVAGINNIVYKNMNGVQVGGIYNKVDQNVKGLQVAGIANITGKTASGLQVAGLVNRAKSLNGVHIAAVNVADTLNGYAINLFSFSRNGYHQLALYTDENLTTTAAFKTGTAKLYTKLIGGVNFTKASTYYTYGIGLGHDFNMGKTTLLSAEFSTQFLASSQWHDTHQLDRFSALINIPLTTKAAVFFGPSFNLYDQGNNNTADEQAALIKNKIALTGIGSNFKAWVGWSIGINLF